VVKAPVAAVQLIDEVREAGGIRREDRRWEVPAAMQERVLEEVHESLAHPGRDAMRAALAESFKWQGMGRDSDAFVRSCMTCARVKSTPGRKLETVCQPASFPNEEAVIDLKVLTGVPSGRGHRYILVVLDRFTRYLQLKVVKRKTAREVAQKLSEVFDASGWPRRVVADSGAEFTNPIVQTIFLRHETETRLTAPYHPESHGAVERSIRRVSEALAALLVGRDRHDWDQVLEKTQKAINATPSSVTGHTPELLFNGKSAETPWSEAEDLPNDVVQRAREDARRRQGRMMTRSAQAADKRKRLSGQRFRVGEMVLYRLPTPASALHPRMSTVMQVTRVESDGHTLRMRRIGGDGELGPERRVNEERVMRAPEGTTLESARESAQTEEEVQVEVERIDAQSVSVEGVPIVRVHWRGRELPSWEATEGLVETAAYGEFMRQRGAE
jgi:hypothetical protein